MLIKIGNIFGNKKCMDIILSHELVKKKSPVNPKLIKTPLILLTRIFGFPPPPIQTSRRALNSERFVIEKIIENKFNNFLEFGSGFGNIALTLSYLTNAAGICVDLDAEDIRVLNELATQLNLKCKGFVENIMNVEINYDSIDVIYSLEVMEHIANDRFLLERSFNMLKKGGRFIFQTPFHYVLKPDETEHKFGHVRNGYSEESFEAVNKGLFNFAYYRIEKRSDKCKFCGDEYARYHPLKLIGVGIKE